MSVVGNKSREGSQEAYVYPAAPYSRSTRPALHSIYHLPKITLPPTSTSSLDSNTAMSREGSKPPRGTLDPFDPLATTGGMRRWRGQSIGSVAG